MASKITSSAKVWKTAAYIRLSREDGDTTESESVVNQKQIIGDYIASQPDLSDYMAFVDDGATGTNFNRQGTFSYDSGTQARRIYRRLCGLRIFEKSEE